jgi:outer membrane protein OmpA-like peptidoglycan-associated protein
MISYSIVKNKFTLLEISKFQQKYKKMKKLIIPLIVLIGLCSNISAQEKSHKELKGDKYAFRYSFDKAIDCYSHTKLLSREGQRRLAESYHNINLNILAEDEYSKILNTTGEVLPEDYYNYAMVLKINGKYDQSIKMMDKFAELKPADLRAKDYEANKTELDYLLADDGKYKIEHLNINSNADDFGTSYFNDKIVFSSSRSKAKMIVRKYNWTGKPFWDMYISAVDGDQLKKPKNFNKKLNGKLHDGPACFSNNGTYMAFTRNHYHDKSKDRVVELQIYFSSFKDGKWLKPEPFILNNDNYSVGQPFLTADGNTMYFTSDMPGGFGGADIYKISKDNNGVWGKAENLGAGINTEGDEMYPFIEQNNGIMFFSSNGRYGLGGLDVFMCETDGSMYGTVYNAGFPLNTRYDDFGAIANDKMSKGYFSSNRTDGNGGDDIYSFDLLKWSNAKVKFTVDAPLNIPVMRRVRELFPIRNYVFFDLGSTEIPDRYVLLEKDQVKEFKEEQLQTFIPKNLSGRSTRQMIIYYNVLNILGDRMVKNPTANVRLSGASAEGVEDGLAMAESVKLYLVNIFGIDASRIKTEGRLKPRIPSEETGTTTELDLKREGDRRVSIWSESPEILMEFQSGPDAPLKPVEIVTVEEAPIESYVTFNVAGGIEALSSWTMEIKDNNGTIQYFGPYFQDQISIPGKTILGTTKEGSYKVTMIGQTKSGMTIKQDTTVNMALWAPSKDAEIKRFTILYEFNDSKAVSIYEKYLTDIVLPKIPIDATVIIHGYTDIIGEEAYNLKLSQARANDVKQIMENGLSKAGRTDVTFEVYGFGEDQNLSLFENKYPEQRFYNRTVMIDIVPYKLNVTLNQ